MKQKLLWASLSLYALTLAAQPPVPPAAKPEHAKGQNPLVANAGETKRATGSSLSDCEISDKLARAAALTESEKQATRLFVAVVGLNARYKEVQQTVAMNELNYKLTSRGELFKQIVQGHNAFVNSSRDSTSGGPNSDRSTPIIVPPALAGAGAGIFLGALNPSSDPESHQSAMEYPRSFRFGGWGLTSSAATSLIYAFGAKSVGESSLPSKDATLSLEQKKALMETVNTSVTAPADYMGQILNWSPVNRSRFSKALVRKILETATQEVRGVGSIYRIDDPKEFAPRLAAKLAEIDFVEILKQEKLADEATIQSLKTIQALWDRYSKLREKDLTPSVAIRDVLTQSQSISENIDSMLRLHKLLTALQAEITKETPGTPIAKDIQGLLSQSEQSIQTVRDLCALGLEK